MMLARRIIRRRLVLLSLSLGELGVSFSPSKFKLVKFDLKCFSSAMRSALVHPREAQTGIGSPTRVHAPDHWVQTNVCCVEGMHEAETDIYVSDFLLLNVSCVLVNN